MNRARFAANGRHAVRALALVVAVATILVTGPRLAGQIARTGWTVVAWNNLGMHCMDADFSVFAILPPYNTIQAQVLDASGHLVKSDSVRVTYQAVADATQSINRTSVGKTNFWQYVQSLFGALPPADMGLTPVASPIKVQQSMPGTANTPQPMQFDPALNWYIAEGIPITPYDDAGRKNYYPMMRVTAKDASGAVLASTNIVLPVSDEMDCRACHASGSGDAAKPAAGWENDPDPQRDYRWNILRLHDERIFASSSRGLYASALAEKGFGADGLYATAKLPVGQGGKPTLCALCHKSEALPVGGVTGVPPLTSAIHTFHAGVIDPATKTTVTPAGLTLGSSDNRSACYRCHPGSETRCLRGAMGNAAVLTVENNVYSASNIQCQNCHGTMRAVGAPPPGGPCDPSTIQPPCPAPTRTGWLDEPTCQNCHTGTATSNTGQIRYTSAGTTDPQTGQWILRQPASPTFATNADTPMAGVSLYRFSSGHGGLQCSACHGSTHAEYTSSHANDNVQSVALQGHSGTIAECGTCHTGGLPLLTLGGPHGMHPIGGSWVSGHHDYVENNRAQCQACHGADYRGTELSRTLATRTLSTPWGTKTLFRGATVGCYLCHNGPSSESGSPNRPPVVSNLAATATAAVPASIPLAGSDADGNSLTFRIVSQPANGAAVLPDPTKAVAVYKANPGWSGTDTFTYAAWDGSVDSSLGTVTVSVTACTVNVTASAPATATLNSQVSFTSSASSNCGGAPVAYDWNFGDGSAHATTQNASHAYATTGTFQWALTATVAGVTTTRNGSVTVSGGTTCTVTATATVPTTGTTGTAVVFSSSVNASGCSGGVTYDWNFGDGSTHATTANTNHAYQSPGTYTWRLQASAGGVVSTRSANITISTTQTSGPVITSIQQLSDPFRVAIAGSNFQSGVKVYIGSDATAWPNVTRSTDGTRLTLAGSGLRSKFPRGQAVAIKVVNPDGKSATGSFTRQ